MALTAVLVEQGHNRLRYLVTSTSTSSVSMNITTTGAPTPDLVTDSLYGPVKRCARAVLDGLGFNIPAATVLTQAQARAIWLAQNADTVLGNSKVPRCILNLTIQAGTANWFVDANVDGSGNALIQITANQTGTCFLDVFTQGSIGI